MYARPYAKKSLNQLESSLLFCNFLVLLTGLMFHDDKFQSDSVREATKISTIVLLAASLAGIGVFVLLELKATLSVFFTKNAAAKRFGDTLAWKYWQAHLPSKSLVSFQKWMEGATGKELESLERLSERLNEIEQVVVSKGESDTASASALSTAASIMSVTYDSRKDHQHLLQSFALLTKLKDNDGAGDLLNFIHTINQGPKRRTGGVLSRISGLTRSCRSGSSMGSFPEIELD